MISFHPRCNDLQFLYWTWTSFVLRSFLPSYLPAAQAHQHHETASKILFLQPVLQIWIACTCTFLFIDLGGPSPMESPKHPLVTNSALFSWFGVEVKTQDLFLANVFHNGEMKRTLSRALSVFWTGLLDNWIWKWAKHLWTQVSDKHMEAHGNPKKALWVGKIKPTVGNAKKKIPKAKHWREPRSEKETFPNQRRMRTRHLQNLVISMQSDIRFSVSVPDLHHEGT